MVLSPVVLFVAAYQHYNSSPREESQPIAEPQRIEGAQKPRRKITDEGMLSTDQIIARRQRNGDLKIFDETDGNRQKIGDPSHEYRGDNYECLQKMFENVAQRDENETEGNDGVEGFAYAYACAIQESSPFWSIREKSFSLEQNEEAEIVSLRHIPV